MQRESEIAKRARFQRGREGGSVAREDVKQLDERSGKRRRATGMGTRRGMGVERVEGSRKAEEMRRRELSLLLRPVVCSLPPSLSFSTLALAASSRARFHPPSSPGHKNKISINLHRAKTSGASGGRATRSLEPCSWRLPPTTKRRR